MLNKQYENRGGVELIHFDDALTYGSNVVGYNDDTYFVKHGRVVQMSGAFKNLTEIASGATFTLGTIKEKRLRPAKTICMLMQGSANNVFWVTMYVDGRVTGQRYRDNNGAQKVNANAWLNCLVTYISQE